MYKGNKKDIKKWLAQRTKRGFSDYDVYEINTWFLNIIPEMISELIKRNNSFPAWLEFDYLKKHNLDWSDLTEKKKEEMVNFCFKKWTAILLEMEKIFREAAKENKCEYSKNPAKRKALKFFVRYFDDLWFEEDK